MTDSTYPTVTCPDCNVTIQSTSVHDYVTCQCGRCMLDGGPNSGYIRANVDQPDFKNQPLRKSTMARMKREGRALNPPDTFPY